MMGYDRDWLAEGVDPTDVHDIAPLSAAAIAQIEEDERRRYAEEAEAARLVPVYDRYGGVESYRDPDLTEPDRRWPGEYGSDGNVMAAERALREGKA